MVVLYTASVGIFVAQSCKCASDFANSREMISAILGDYLLYGVGARWLALTSWPRTSSVVRDIGQVAWLAWHFLDTLQHFKAATTEIWPLLLYVCNSPLHLHVSTKLPHVWFILSYACLPVIWSPWSVLGRKHSEYENKKAQDTGCLLLLMLHTSMLPSLEILRIPFKLFWYLPECSLE